MRSSPTDLFFLSRDALDRVPLSRGAAARDAAASRPRPAGQPAAALLDDALRGIGRGRSVLLFLADAWCQTIDVGEMQLEGLTEKERGSMLALEAEAFSGLPPARSACAWALGEPAAGRVPCTVLQLPLRELEALAGVFRRRRVALAGVSHPLFLGDAAATAAALAERFLALGGVPMIAPPRQPPSPYRCFYIGAALAALAAAVCCQTHFGTGRSVRRMAAEDRTLSGLRAELGRIEKRARSLQDEMQKEKAERAAAAEREKKRRRARGAMAFLFRAMAGASSPSLAIRKIGPFGPFGIRAEGWCVSPGDADAFFDACGRAAAERGWQLRPESIEARKKIGGSGPCRFSFVLLPPGFEENDVRRRRRSQREYEEEGLY